MSPATAMLADLTAYEVQGMRQSWKFSSLPYVVVFLAILLGVSILGCVFIVLTRRKRKRRHHHHHQSADPSPARNAVPATAAAAVPERRRRRRRRRVHRPLNPTLAETGGLPPIRDANTPPPGL